MKLKITDLKETRFRPSFYRDRNGNRVRTKEQYSRFREVRTVSGGARFGHFFIDSIVFMFLFSLLSLIFALTLETITDPVFFQISEFISGIIIFLIYPLFYFLFENKWQQTPGKMLNNTVVIDQYGNKPSTRQLIMRSLLRLVPLEPYSCFGDRSRGWHDKWSDTWVVK